MAYRRPGVTVTQEFLGLVPALATFALPSVSVGPAFQLVEEDLLGSYAAEEQLFPYASLLGGAIVDLAGSVDSEVLPLHPFPITTKDISAVLRDAKVEVVSEKATGAVSGTSFTDSVLDQFLDVHAGDIVRVVPATDVEIIAARADGVTVSTVGQRNRLYSGSGNPLLFANVIAGDVVTVTSGGYFGTQDYVVVALVGTNLLILDSEVNDGSGDVSTLEYSIAGDRGASGDYAIRSVVDGQTVTLVSPISITGLAPLKYIILRRAGDITLTRVSAVSGNGFVAEPEGITLPAILTYATLPVVEGVLVASYRAIRIDLASEVRQFVNVASLNSVFGVGQTTPANILAYGISLMLQNTVTPVHGLGLDANAFADEVLSFVAAADVLKLEDMYAIALLTHNSVVHTTFKNHVEQLSAPDMKLERVVIFNSRLAELMVLKEAATTVTTVSGARQIVGMQIDGVISGSATSTLTDATAGQFSAVEKGDSVVVVGGTNAIVRTLTVLAVVDEHALTLSGAVSSGASTDISYYIYRLDGLAAGGASFYDRNASFLADSIASGHYLTILSGDYEGRYRIATVVSDKEVTLLPVVIAAQTLATAVEYQVDRDLSKAEQADAVQGYSEAFASRRCVHVWPDQLELPVGQSLYYVPGFFAASVIAGLTSGLPTQQGFTNLSVSGFLGLRHSSKYFSDDQLNVIADGGTMILAQDGPSQPLYIRHQLTTDRSSIKFQEFSITKNVDFIAKFLRGTYSPFIGQYNIVDTTIDTLRMAGGAALKFLKEKTRVPRFGGVIRTGTLVSLTEDAEQIDTVNIVFSLGIPIPLNNIDIVIQI